METSTLMIFIKNDLTSIKTDIENNFKAWLEVDIDSLLEKVNELETSYFNLLSLKEEISCLYDWGYRYDRDHNWENSLQLNRLLYSTFTLMRKMDIIDSLYIPRESNHTKQEFIWFIKYADIDDAKEFTMKS